MWTVARISEYAELHTNHCVRAYVNLSLHLGNIVTIFQSFETNYLTIEGPETGDTRFD